MKIRYLILILSFILASISNVFGQIDTISVDILPTTSGIVIGDGEYFTGSLVNLEAKPNFGYEFEYWAENGSKISADSLLSFISFGNRKLTANFKLKSYTIGATPLPLEGGNTIGEGIYLHGSNVILEANKNIGYSFINWTENNIEVSTDTVLIFPALKSQDYIANFSLNNYLVTASASPSGTGIIQGTGNFNHGDSVFLKAIPAIGYSFESWSENGAEISSDTLLSFIAQKNRQLTAHFSLNSYLVNASASPIIGGTVGGTGNFNHGDSVFLEAIPAIGYGFESWSENSAEISSDSVYKFIADSHRNLTAHFSLNIYNINATASPIIGGTVGGTGNFHHGVLAQLVATHASGYIFSNWSEGDSVVSVDSNYQFIVDRDRDLIANFSEKQFLVTTNVYPEFSGITKGDSNYTNLSLVRVSASPQTGWVFNNWSEDGKILAVDSAYSFVVLEDRNLTANFSKKIYNLNLSSFPTEGGEVNGFGSYSHDSLVTISAIPSVGWHFLHWMENDTIVSSDSLISFNIINEKSLVAKFEKNVYQVSTLVFPESAGNTIGDSIYTFGDSVYLVAIPNANSGWEFVNWTKGELEVSQDSVFTFLSNENVNLMAHFRLKDYSVNLLPFPENAGIVQGLGTYTHGDSVTVSAEPAAGWLFANWTDGVNNVSSEPTLTFSIDSDKILIANFAHELYSVNSTPQPAEAGYVSGSGTFYYNQMAALMPVANPGWEFVNWTENETEISSDSLLSLSIKENLIIKANFKQINYSINCIANPVEGWYYF